MNLQEQFMAGDIFPIMDVASKSGSYGVIPVENVTDETGDGKRSPKSGYQRNESSVETANYDCVEYGFEEPLDDSNEEDLKQILDAEREVTFLNVHRLLRVKEIRAAAVAFNATTFSSQTAGVSTEWSSASGTPYSDIQDIMLTLKQQVGGVLPMGAEVCVAMSEKVYRNAVQTTEIQGKILGGDGSTVDKTPSTSRDILSRDRFARILGVDRVFSSAAQKEVNGTASDIWDDEYCLIFIRNTGGLVRRMTPQLGRTFNWANDGGNPYTVEQYREESVRSDIFRARHQVQEKIVNLNAGYLLSNITA
jgi:hypothetical protein